MLFGISSAPEIFHRTMKHITDNMHGVPGYADGIVLWGSTLQQHSERLNKVLQHVQKYGLKLNRAKCHLGVTEIYFVCFGDSLSALGAEPDKNKIKAILKTLCTANKKIFILLVNSS